MLQFDQLEEGNFYYVLEHNDEPENRFVWYKRDGCLKNPRCCSDTLYTTEQYHYRPLTPDKVDEFDEWMEKHGDCIGRIAWIAYQMKLKEANMAEKNDAEKKKEVDLYESKFVRFDWDESLDNKFGFFSDTIETLKYLVRNNTKDSRDHAYRFNDKKHPFNRHEFNRPSIFFYYDPNYEIKWAYFKEGKTVQYRPRCASNWTVVPVGVHTTFFDDDCEYRIKPEDPKPDVEVNVDVKVNTSSNGKIKITINGKECIFENAEQARMVLQGN